MLQLAHAFQFGCGGDHDTTPGAERLGAGSNSSSTSVDRALTYHVKGPRFEYQPGHCAAWIWVYYPCGSVASFRLKPRCVIRAYAFKIMR